MTDWEKFKVAELKEECKSRRISITGLKLKQQFIDKLSEYESSTSPDAAPAEESVAEKTNGVIDEVAPAESTPQPTSGPEGEDGGHEQEQEPDATEDLPLAVERDPNLPAERPAALKVEDSQASAVEAEAEAADTPMAESAQEAKDIQQDDMLIPAPEQLDVDQNVQEAHKDGDDTEMDDAEEKLKEEIKGPEPTKIVDSAEKPKTTETTPEEESRKRKRRSITPPPDAEEIAKKAKVTDGEAVVTKRVSRSPSPRSPSSKQESSENNSRRSSPGRAEPDRDKNDQKSEDQPRQRQRSPSVDKDESVEPAIHAATRSLYMRNFKRPLNIQVLRSHILTIAQGSSSVAQGEDPIKFYNVNNIRSHAFVTFSSIAAASRVRAAMHQTRFPDEPQREPLWVDFVPDDKVESWVDQETSGSRGSARNSASKLEVVYNNTGEGMEVVFRGVNSYPQRPSIGTATNSRSSVSQRQTSYSVDPSRTGAIASGVHPDRAGLVPTSPKVNRRPSPPPAPIPQRRHNDQGIGFKGLDDLFSSTEAKPKIYYKLPPQSVIDDRQEMIKTLYPDRGVTGDPGMKRYTFERENGREDWADNGPEFGHGKRGQDRLVGTAARGRGGYRGRGGRAAHFGGDSYRGSGRR